MSGDVKLGTIFELIWQIGVSCNVTFKNWLGDVIEVSSIHFSQLLRLSFLELSLKELDKMLGKVFDRAIGINRIDGKLYEEIMLNFYLP